MKSNTEFQKVNVILQIILIILMINGTQKAVFAEGLSNEESLFMGYCPQKATCENAQASDGDDFTSCGFESTQISGYAQYYNFSSQLTENWN